MTYAPQFNRPVQGNYSDQKAYMALVMGSNANIMDDEFNEMQWLATYQRARLMTEIHSTGFLYKGTDSVTASTLTLAPRDLLMAGHLLYMSGQAANSGNVLATLPAAPNTGTRQDLVYLVMYLTEITKDSGPIYKYGYQQGDTLTNDMLDARAPGETTRRIQKQWTIKIASAVTSITDASLGYAATSYDPNLYTKANGSTADGVEYAIPIYLINRNATEGTTPPTLTEDAFYIRTQKNAGKAGGYATVDPSTGVVPLAQLPSDFPRTDVAQTWTADQTIANGHNIRFADSAGHTNTNLTLQNDDNLVLYGSKSDGTNLSLLSYKTNQATTQNLQLHAPVEVVTVMYADNQASAPASPPSGQSGMYASGNRMLLWNGTAWVDPLKYQ